MLEYFTYYYGNQIIGLVLCLIFGMLGNAARKIYQEHIDDDTKRAVARTAATFVEQVWKNLHGEEKLQKALKTAEYLLRKKNIPFDAEEMMVLIEAAVAEFNEAFRKPVEAETAKGVYRVPSDVEAAFVSE